MEFKFPGKNWSEFIKSKAAENRDIEKQVRFSRTTGANSFAFSVSNWLILLFFLLQVGKMFENDPKYGFSSVYSARYRT